MSFLEEFKKFAMRGNVVDMAVGLIIGAAFGKIVSSMVEDIITPPIGLLIGGVNFTDLKWVIKEIGANSQPITIAYGKFLQTVFDFLIVSFTIFVVVKLMNALKKKEDLQAAVQAPPPASSTETAEQSLLKEIRDILKEKK